MNKLQKINMFFERQFRIANKWANCSNRRLMTKRSRNLTRFQNNLRKRRKRRRKRRKLTRMIIPYSA
jgi:hypothetical protein